MCKNYRIVSIFPGKRDFWSDLEGRDVTSGRIRVMTEWLVPSTSHQDYVKLRKETTDLAKDKKTNAIKKKIEEGSSKALYQVYQRLHRMKSSQIIF